MNINYDSVTILVTFIYGVYLSFVGVKSIKKEEKRRAGVLLMFMAICAFAFSILAILVYALKPTRSWSHIVIVIQAIITGVWLGVFMVKLIFAHFKLLNTPCEISSKDS